MTCARQVSIPEQRKSIKSTCRKRSSPQSPRAVSCVTEVCILPPKDRLPLSSQSCANSRLALPPQPVNVLELVVRCLAFLPAEACIAASEGRGLQARPMQRSAVYEAQPGGTPDGE